MVYCKEADERYIADDSELVGLTLTEDETAYQALVEKYWNLMVGLAVHQVGNITEAEDIAQEAFIQAYHRMATLRDPARFGFWLGRIVRNLCADHLRSRGWARLISIDDLPERFEPVARMPSLAPELNEAQRGTVRQAMGRLPDRFRQVLLMRFSADLPLHEIARQMGKRPGTIRVWLHRALERMRKELEGLKKEVDLS